MFDIFYARKKYMCVTFGTMNGVIEYLWDCGLHPNKWYLEGKEVIFKGGPTGIEVVHWETPEGVDEKEADKKSLEWSRKVCEANVKAEYGDTDQEMIEGKVELEMLLKERPTYTVR